LLGDDDLELQRQWEHIEFGQRRWAGGQRIL